MYHSCTALGLVSSSRGPKHVCGWCNGYLLSISGPQEGVVLLVASCLLDAPEHMLQTMAKIARAFAHVSICVVACSVCVDVFVGVDVVVCCLYSCSTNCIVCSSVRDCLSECDCLVSCCVCVVVVCSTRVVVLPC